MASCVSSFSVSLVAKPRHAYPAGQRTRSGQKTQVRLFGQLSDRFEALFSCARDFGVLAAVSQKCLGMATLLIRVRW